MQNPAILRETVCIKQVRESAIAGKGSQRVSAAGPIPDHVRIGQFRHVVSEANLVLVFDPCNASRLLV
jgi:hypothetical protein